MDGNDLINAKLDYYDTLGYETIRQDIDNPEELDQQKNDFFDMPKHRHKQSDELSLMLTGMTNKERYNHQAEKITSDITEAEYGDITPPIKFSTKAIEVAKQWEIDSNIKMIYPSDDMNYLYARFNDQPNNLKDIADEKCIELFGMKNEELYNLLSSCDYKIANNVGDYSLTLSLETALDEDDERAIEKIDKELKRKIKKDDPKWELAYSPMLTPQEISVYKHTYSDEDVDDKYKVMREEYEKAFYGVYNDFSPTEWDKEIRRLMYYKENTNIGDPNKLNTIKESLVQLGWNPEIEYNSKNIGLARGRIERAYQQQVSEVSIIDCTDLYKMNVQDISITEAVKSGYYPVHIVLIRGNAWFSGLISKFSDGPYSHSAICIDNDFSRLYSFNMSAKNKLTTKSNGFSLESIKNFPQDNQLGIYTIFVDKDQYETIEYNIQQMVLYQNKTGYSMLNLMTILFKNINLNIDAKMICSQFVDKMLKLANIDITGTPSDKVTPNTFYKVAMVRTNIYKTYEGPVKDFDPKREEKLVERMSMNARKINEFSIERLSDIYTNPVILEVKSPIAFTSDGDLLLSKPLNSLDMNEEYSKSHALLKAYDESNNYEGIKYELCRLFYMNHLLEREIRKGKDRQRNINTRARVLNDFNKYMKIVLRNQPKFNFSEYFEKSPYAPNVLEIDNGTIKYTTSKLKSLLRLI